MRVKRWIGALVGGAAVMAGVTVATPAAQAADPCAEGYVCMYEHENYTGSAYRPEALRVNNQRINFDGHFKNGRPVNDRVSSIRNYTNHWVYLYKDWDGGGSWIVIQPWAKVDRFVNILVEFDAGVYPKGKFNDQPSSASASTDEKHWSDYR